MLAKSDLIILVISATALAGGIYRWQHNTTVVPAVTIAASSRVSEPAIPAVANVQTVPNSAANSVAAPSVTRVVNEAAAPVTVVVGQNSEQATSLQIDTGAEQNVGGSTPAATVLGQSGNQVQDPPYGVYRVRSGDYLGRIATRFGTTVQTLQSMNGINGTTILVGQEIRYPSPAN